MRESAKRAQVKYVKKSVKRIELRFYPKDDELFEFAKGLGSTGIKALIEKEKEGR